MTKTICLIGRDGNVFRILSPEELERHQVRPGVLAVNGTTFARWIQTPKTDAYLEPVDPMDDLIFNNID
jgi:hypothetical protein